MGRLIDADKLLEETRKDRDYAEKNGFLDMYYERQTLIDRIKSQPTAYDLDEVVEQLEEIRVKKTCNKEKCDTKELCRICVVDDAIEIVKQEAEKYDNGWISASERLPEERDWYLAVFEEVDTGFIGIPYIAEYLMGARTMYTTKDGWIIRNCTDIEGGSLEYYKNLKCVAWQPLPQPYKNGER